ncbi:MAG: alkaline phosphatase family protein, partial [Microbacteriaceae bacterium]|nr:alkaline phosphatase family protein [Microbacteriaceae bacterium]
LGSVNLSARSAHARNIGSLSRSDVLSGFPTTTASALTTLMTGRSPGQTGMLGYAIRDPATGNIVNQLSGLDALTPEVWQPAPTLWEQNTDIPTAIISSPRYRDSGLTRAILRGAQYVSAKSWGDRLGAIDAFFASHREGVAYVYIAELDMAAHASGVASDQWVRRLEELDGFIADVQRRLLPTDGLVITADHGVLDVPVSRHWMVPAGSTLLDGVTVGGEPRFLHLYAENKTALLERWRESEGNRSHVASREEAIAAGWFGTVENFARERIGDVLVTPRGESVYYIEGIATEQSMAMVGQHGGLSRTETLIPVIRGGAFG